MTQSAVVVGAKSSPEEEEADQSYHTDSSYRWNMDQLDPSLALCFFCQTQSQFQDLIKDLRAKVLTSKSAGMFEIYEKSPAVMTSAHDLVEAIQDSEDEFEMI